MNHRDENEKKYKEVIKIITRKIEEAETLWLQNECKKSNPQNKYMTLSTYIKMVKGKALKLYNSSVLSEHKN